ncbi:MULTISPECIES: hypothetical protein [unclassified Sinorhizobium]|uniref:hypothetical protein n=1 Tax=unclassified Sinorhizobium TaxID=2613772 RepID=UPI0035259FC7
MVELNVGLNGWMAAIRFATSEADSPQSAPNRSLIQAEPASASWPKSVASMCSRSSVLESGRFLLVKSASYRLALSSRLKNSLMAAVSSSAAFVLLFPISIISNRLFRACLVNSMNNSAKKIAVATAPTL